MCASQFSYPFGSVWAELSNMNLHKPCKNFSPLEKMDADKKPLKRTVSLSYCQSIQRILKPISIVANSTKVTAYYSISPPTNLKGWKNIHLDGKRSMEQEFNLKRLKF